MSRFGSDPRAFFKSVYNDIPPWDIGGPQPALSALFTKFPPIDPILDVGLRSAEFLSSVAPLCRRCARASSDVQQEKSYIKMVEIRQSMKAIIWTKYGPPDVLQLQQVEKPAPKDNEVLIRVYATAVTTGDCEMRALNFPLWIRLPMRIYVGLRKPKRVSILGGYLAGKIEALGKNVTRFNVGDEVFGFTGLSFGGYAEYICLPEEGRLVRKPVNLTYEEAAPVALGGLEALHFLRKANIQPGQTILINGAGGSIGTFAVQLAKYYGAEVTAVDSTAKLDLLRSIGADHVIDYTREDFTKNGRTYDVIFDVVLKSPFSQFLKSLKENGIYLLTNPTLFKMIRGKWISANTNRQIIFEMTSPNTDDLHILKELLETGKIKSIIDRRYRLEQTAEAHRYVETGHKKGNVIIEMPITPT